ncbi:uncharacterized protein RCO7_02833 [Rhynchosporium graminicola]|uniref:Uncharacterized protein n=1 Tax=Rhynchosporium graminicola TaxID=2792576 RepID=A0A1E1KSL7_9HELO|nr:uncharacterized protein RCO7_02833 [Rhynchosporium commune]
MSSPEKHHISARSDHGRHSAELEKPSNVAKDPDLLQSAMPNHGPFLDLPNELLIMICAQILGLRPHIETSLYFPEYTQGMAEIRKVRGICRKLRDISYRLLVPIFTLDFADPVSIERFEKISQNEEIRKGVMGVIIIHRPYSRERSADFRVFARYHVNRLSYLIKAMGHDVRSAREKDAFGSASSSRGRMRLPNYFEKRVRGIPKRESSQWEWRDNKSFCERIAVAMARMPSATSLKVANTDSCYTIGDIVRPMDPLETFARDCGYPPIDLLFKLLVAFHKAGIALAKLDIRSVMPKKYSEQDLEDLRNVLQKLKTFVFSPFSWKYSTYSALTESFPFIQRLASTILDSPNLQTISLDPEDITWGHFCRTFVSPLYTALSLEELAKVMDACTGSPVKFLSCDLLLLDAKWADGLELLRGKFGPGSTLFSFASRCSDPVTGKVTDIEIFNKEGRFFKGFTFLDWRDSTSAMVIENTNVRDKVDNYITGMIEENPLRKTNKSFEIQTFARDTLQA